jgi:hypothetical protein
MDKKKYTPPETVWVDLDHYGVTLNEQTAFEWLRQKHHVIVTTLTPEMWKTMEVVIYD